MDDIRLKRIRMRAWRRGFREADLIMGPFADEVCPTLTSQQLDAFEALLNAPDQDVYGWIIGRQDIPPEHDTDVMAMLKAFEPSKTGQPRGA
jgi:antitoxin CptB